MYRVGPYAFTATDTERTLASLGELWRHIVHARTKRDLRAPTERAQQLATELADQLGLDPVRDTGGTEITSLEDIAALLDRVGTGAAQRVGDDTVDTTALLDTAWSTMRSIATTIAAGDEYRGPNSRSGVVAQLNVSAGGVPKSPVDRAEIDWTGIVGDQQRARQHHGRPWQALCLWSVEIIDRFNTTGHHLRAGAAGENITVAGLDWREMRPGATIAIDEVVMEISAYSIPCSKNAQWFDDGDFNRMHYRQGPVSRVYATVLEPGQIRTGSAVERLR